MRKVLTANIAVLIGLSSFCFAETNNIRPKVVVAVIDTGLDSSLMHKPWICKDGNKDFTGTSLKDNHGHGTHIAGLVEQYAKNKILGKSTLKELDVESSVDFCIMILKFYDPASKLDFIDTSNQALEWALLQKVDVINYSGGGVSFSRKEHDIVQRIIKAGIKIVAAAGNERSNIDVNKFYPAMHDPKNIIIVGNLVSAHSRAIATSSNYGKSVNAWEVGTNVISRSPGGTVNLMSGTSQSAAIKSGKIVREMLLRK